MLKGGSEQRATDTIAPENQDNPESKEKELVKTPEDSASKKDDSENKINKEA